MAEITDRQQVSAGRMRFKVSIMRRTKATNTFAEEVGDFVFLDFAWADITEVNSTETFEGGQLASHALVQIDIRYYSGLTRNDQIHYGSRVFFIREIVTRGHNKWMRLMCAEDRG